MRTRPRLLVTNAPPLQAYRHSNSATVNGDYNDAYAYLGDGNTATVTGEWGCAGPSGPAPLVTATQIIWVNMVASENTLGRG